MQKTIGIILYANPDHYPPTINAIHLLAEHFNIVLIGRNQDPPVWKYPANVKVHRLGKYTSVREREKDSAISKFAEYTNFVAQASRLLKDVSLIYAYDAFGYNVAYLCRLLLGKKIPIIYHNHDLNDQLFSLYSLSGWIQRFERKFINQANLVVFPSQERASFFRKLTNYDEEITIVPNFPRKSFYLKHQDFPNLIKERFHKLQILLQGTISVKNSLLELIASLTLLDQGIELKLIGQIQQAEYDLMLDVANKYQVASRMQYFKPVPYDELPSHTWMASLGVCLYKKTDINHQTMGTASNKIYEYAACGLPVIVSGQPNYREHLAQEKWVRFADPDDPQSIASAVQDIISNWDDYQQMCLAARQAFEEKYNYESAFYPLLLKIKTLLQ